MQIFDLLVFPHGIPHITWKETKQNTCPSSDKQSLNGKLKQ